MKNAPHDSFERTARASGHSVICGVDEVGRGPLAGPVVASAVVLDPSAVPTGLNDSKKLTAEARQSLAEIVLHDALSVCVVSLDAEQVDRLNIRAASLEAMAMAVAGLSLEADWCLIDGNTMPPTLMGRGEAIISGDARSVSIAAASIVAKVMRDEMMETAAAKWPHYGFERHKGYGTAEHRNAMADKGPCPIHRFSFAPLKHA